VIREERTMKRLVRATWLGAGLVCFWACGGDAFETSPGSGDAGVDAVAESGVDAIAESGSDVQEGESGADVQGDTTAVEKLGITPGEHGFRAVLPHSESLPVEFTVTNEGSQPTGPIEAELTNPSFQIRANDCGVLKAGESCSVAVRFLAGEQDSSASASLTVSATPGGIVAATLTGEARAVVSEGLEIAPKFYDFEAIATGESASASFTVKNIGKEPTEPLGLSIVQSGAPVFSISANPCGSLVEGESCDFLIKYSPIESEPGKKTVQVRAVAGDLLATQVVSGHTKDVFVRANGNDDEDGLSVKTAFQTITHALQAVDEGWNVRVLPGTYQEPALGVQGVRLIGAGSGATQPTVIEVTSLDEQEARCAVRMRGSNPELRGVVLRPPAQTGPDLTAILMDPEDKATVVGTVVELSPNWTGLGTDSASLRSFDVRDTEIRCAGATNTRGVAVYGNAVATFEGLRVLGCSRGMTISDVTTTTVRSSRFEGILGNAVAVESAVSLVDLGTYAPGSGAVPGGNVFLSSSQSFVGLHVWPPNGGVLVKAHGNTWLKSVQGADSTDGSYDHETVAGPVGKTSGEAQNYAIKQDSSIEF
jgi:hypothetical protein